MKEYQFAYLIEDRFSQLIKGCVDVDVRLRRGFQETATIFMKNWDTISFKALPNSVILCDLLSPLATHYPFVCHVALVAQQHFLDIFRSVLKILALILRWWNWFSLVKWFKFEHFNFGVEERWYFKLARNTSSDEKSEIENTSSIFLNHLAILSKLFAFVMSYTSIMPIAPENDGIIFWKRS